MIINSISLRNFKSYGNNLQTLKFNNESQLILIHAPNGQGKSSLLESIDFSIFNVVRGKVTKRVPTYVLPNRFNKNLETEINFNNWLGDNVIINRKLAQKGFSIHVNGVDITDRYDNFTPKQKEDIIGIEYNTYKSLVSLNLADFANFINLDTDTKKKLLNKLFDLDEIDIYLSMAKEVLKNFYKQRDKIEAQLLANKNMINSYNDNIKNIIEKTTESVDKNELRSKMSELKSSYELLKQEMGDLQHNLYPLHTIIKNNVKILNAQKDKLFKDEYELGEIYKKIELFESGNCPMCGTVLDGSSHKMEHDKLNDNYKKLKSSILDFKNIHSSLKIETRSKNNEKNDIQQSIDDIENKINNIKKEMGSLKIIYNKDNDSSISVSEINKNISEVELSNDFLLTELNTIDDKISKHDKLVEMLSEKGIRRGIIGNIVEPINEHITRYLMDLESSYNVRLNDSFDAVIKDRFIDEIHVETLSTGEARKINIAIALSYMEIILSMNKKTNILFMDEVFASVDPENVNLMLTVLKKFSVRNNINVIIATPLDIDKSYFDRIISIEKTLGYSQIIEV